MSLDFEDDSLDSEEFVLDGEANLTQVESDEDDDGEMAEGYDEQDFVAMGIDPARPTKARPGSEAKVIMLSARYAAGLPLWNNDDCYEHGPRENDLMGFLNPQRV
ncbi:MAG: hypothetical protein KDA68_21635 [Planctomycetaceae bacterium]|nr:hypothetical protein [Planctomycetaceae bacterium]